MVSLVSRSTLAGLAGVLALCGSTGALAAAGSSDPEISKAFSGTIVSTYPDGRKGRLWLSANGTYQASGRKGDRSSGKWTVKGEKVCLKQSKPFPAPFSFCTAKPSSTQWRAKAVTGEPIVVRLESGGRPD